jgi:hypothetical protein
VQPCGLLHCFESARSHACDVLDQPLKSNVDPVKCAIEMEHAQPCASGAPVRCQEACRFEGVIQLDSPPVRMIDSVRKSATL